jgi:hypothetical protein
MTVPSRARPWSRAATALLAGSLLVALPGKVAGSDPGSAAAGSVPEPAATADCRPLSLHGALPNPRPGDLFLRPGAATCDEAQIEVAADALAGVFTASFDLRYPATLMKYTGFTVGTLLQRTPVTTQPLCLVQESSPGVIEVTMTRFAPDHGVTAQGSETLLVLRFARVAPGSGGVDFNLDPSSPVAERIVDDSGSAVAARFGPGHGLKLTVYQR